MRRARIRTCIHLHVITNVLPVQWRHLVSVSVENMGHGEGQRLSAKVSRTLIIEP